MKLSLDIYDIPEKLKVWRDKQEKSQQLHVGTHIDTYNKTELGESPVWIRGIVVDVIGKADIGIEVLDGVKVKKGDFIIFRTGYMEKFGYGSNQYFNLEGAPQLKRELIDVLLEKKVKFIGIDLHGIKHKTDHKKIDIYCEEAGTYVIENLKNLDKIGKEIELELSWKQTKEVTAIPVEIQVSR